MHTTLKDQQQQHLQAEAAELPSMMSFRALMYTWEQNETQATQSSKVGLQLNTHGDCTWNLSRTGREAPFPRRGS